MAKINNVSCLPTFLSGSALDQFDHALCELKSDSLVSMCMVKDIYDNKVAFSSILNVLNGIDCIKVRSFSMSGFDLRMLDKYQTIVKAICFDKNGGSYVVSRAYDDGHIQLDIYGGKGVIKGSFKGEWSNLKYELDLLEDFLVLKKIVKEKILSSQDSFKISDDMSYDKDFYGKEMGVDSRFVYSNFIMHKKYAFSILGLAIMLALLGVVTPLGFQTFTDKILPYSATNSLLVVAILLFLAAVATATLQCTRDYQESVLFAKYQNGLGKEVFKRLLAMDVPFFDQRKVGELTKLVDQVEEASNFLVRQLLSSVVSVISLLVVLPILFIYSVKLSLIVIGIGVVMAITVGVSLKPLRERVTLAYRYDAGFQSSLIEMLKGMRTIKSLSNESHFRHRSNASLEHNLYGGFNVERLSNVVRAIVSFQSQLITIAVIFFGAQAVFAQQMTIGQLIAFNMLANNVVNPLVSLVMTASGWETFKLAKRKLGQLVPPEPPAMQLSSDQTDLNGDIQFKDVWFRYPRADEDDTKGEPEPVLKGINLTIRQGEIIGIVGGSGSGKSTLANLLLGFYKPSRGKIKINGYDLDLINPSHLRSRISSVQQTSFLFNASVMENIHLGRLDSDVPAIQKALEESGSQSFVDEMPQKFMTSLSEDGGNLSGGQRQRLAIARALVRNSDILLFDEATSALDNQTEQKIKETIHAACQGKTGIIIAHRLNTLSYCDRIVVMQHGRIEAVGSHDELLAGDNSYKIMWESMLKRDADLDRLSLVATKGA